MSKTLFGTDGIRGQAGNFPVTTDTARNLGRAVGRILASEKKNAPVLIGRDTRESGPWLEQAVIEGLQSEGVDAISAGVIPTPGVACLTRELHAAAGIVISASHNPYEDNGLKVFQGDGTKCPDALEKDLERLILHPEPRPAGVIPGKHLSGLSETLRYTAAARASFPAHLDLRGLVIALDCANGAAITTSPAVLRELGAEVHVFHDQPDGRNINLRCGSTYPEVLQNLVRQTSAHLGIAHDGDADRLICCDETGEIVDGDEILAMLGIAFLQRGDLKQNTLVATVMSNFGLEECLAPFGGKVMRTAVGDRYVMQEMLAHNLNVGGEQSGHLIFRDYSTTGDGLISALQVLRLMRESGKPLGELKRCLHKYPQLLVNLKVREKKPFDTLPQVQEAVRRLEAEYNGRGRVLLRYSGTEPKVRLLLEAREGGKLAGQAETILAPLREALGS